MAHGLPVALIPEQPLIALVRNDVVNDRGGEHALFASAAVRAHAQRMLGKELKAPLLPLPTIKPLGRTAALAIMLSRALLPSGFIFDRVGCAELRMLRPSTSAPSADLLGSPSHIEPPKANRRSGHPGGGHNSKV